MWVDDMGRDSIRKNGYAIKGETPAFHRLLERGQRITSMAALTVDGVLTVLCTKNTVNGL